MKLSRINCSMVSSSLNLDPFVAEFTPCSVSLRTVSIEELETGFKETIILLDDREVAVEDDGSSGHSLDVDAFGDHSLEVEGSSGCSLEVDG